MNLTVIKWRDIPTQVMIKKSRREVEKIQLNNRFMEAVDSAASVADATDADAYLTDWKNEVIEIPDGDLKGPVANKAAELESAFTQEKLMNYVNNGGYKP
ncbi:MAG: virulence factor [Candidatus Thioglobus sp.]|nr:virulence factor [Candidatus Thioglobus sp.]